jgi:hypothetical protein
MVVLIAFLAKNVLCAKKISSSLISSQRLRQITNTRHHGAVDLYFRRGAEPIEIVKKRGLIGSYYVVTDGGAVVHFDFDGRDVWKFSSQAQLDREKR